MPDDRYVLILTVPHIRINQATDLDTTIIAKIADTLDITTIDLLK